MAKKKASRKKKATPAELFSDWWGKVAEKKVAKIERAWLKANDPNEEEEPGGDHWHVNQMMHDGHATDMTYEIAERVFMLGFEGKMWKPSMGDSLFCDLDEVVELAYLAGKEMVT